MSAHNPHDFWPAEREGFSEQLRPAYAAVRFTPSPPRRRWVRLEESAGALIAGAGLCWAADAVGREFALVLRFGIWPAGPLELCACGILVWMHAKWRRSVRLE